MRATYTVRRPRYHNVGSRIRRATANVTHTDCSVYRPLAHVRHQEALRPTVAKLRIRSHIHKWTLHTRTHDRARGWEDECVRTRPKTAVVMFPTRGGATVAAFFVVQTRPSRASPPSSSPLSPLQSNALPGTPAPWRHDFAATTTKNPRPEVPILRGSNAWVRRLTARATATGLGCPSPARSPHPGSWTRHYVGPSVLDFI